MLLSKKIFSFKINKLSTTDNIFNGKPCDILYTGYLNKDISVGDIVYFQSKNIQYKKLVNEVTDRLKYHQLMEIVMKYRVILRYQLCFTLFNFL